MFDHVVFRRSNKLTDIIDIGQMAEILLYYGKLELLLDTGNLSYLLGEIGYDSLLRLVQIPRVNAFFVSDIPAVVTNTNVIMTHNFATLSLAAHVNGVSLASKVKKLEEIFERKLGAGWRARKQAQFIAQYLPERSIIKGVAGDTLIDNVKKDVLDRPYLLAAARMYLNEKVPSFSVGTNFKFEALEFDRDFIIDTSLNFDKLNLEYKRNNPPTDEVITSATILSEIFEARAALGIAANFKSDVVATTLTSKIMQLRVSSAISSLTRDRSEITAFEEWVLDSKNIRDTINSGVRTFSEFLDFLETAKEFNNWTAGQSDDQSLAKEYMREVSSMNWLDALPGKTVRYAAFTGASILTGLLMSPLGGAIVGAGLSAADAFLVDKIAKGWKPNHFVNGNLRKFIA